VISEQSPRLAKTIAVVRIATGFLFLLFGEYKVASSDFAHSGFPKYLQGYIQGEAVSFYRPFLANVVQPHTVFFGYAVGVVELWIAVSMIAGLWVRVTSIVGALFMLNLTLCACYILAGVIDIAVAENLDEPSRLSLNLSLPLDYPAEPLLLSRSVRPQFMRRLRC